jgi:hypothetical protein
MDINLRRLDRQSNKEEDINIFKKKLWASNDNTFISLDNVLGILLKRRGNDEYTVSVIYRDTDKSIDITYIDEEAASRTFKNLTEVARG